MTWRNIADYQMEKEREKHVAKQQQQQQQQLTPKGSSIFSSIFGTTTKPSTAKQPSSGENVDEEEEPPIHLTIEELKEMEDLLNKEDTKDQVSQDSKLYDISFVWQAFKVHLTNYDSRPVAALDMGQVTTQFQANANGSFGFDFQLAHLTIQDQCTPHSLFPNVLRNIQEQQVGDEGKEEHVNQHNGQAFQLHLNKTKTGDQKLLVKLAAFEAVASPILLEQIYRFFSITTAETKSTQAMMKQNPILAQSLSGSVDLFYDADPGASVMHVATSPSLARSPLELAPNGNTGSGTTPRHIATATSTTSAATSSSSNTFSNALMDAWKEKTKTKSAWVMDVNVKAPVLVLPKNCTDPRAPVLILDLGHLQLSYGQLDPAPQVMEWFQKQQSQQQASKAISINKSTGVVDLDVASISITHLTFLVATASDWRQRILFESGRDSAAVIQPIEVSFDIGIESSFSSGRDDGLPRICAFGVIPTIALRLEPVQGSTMLSVIHTWKELIDEMHGGEGEDHEVDADLELEPEQRTSLDPSYDDFRSARQTTATQSTLPTVQQLSVSAGGHELDGEPLTDDEPKKPSYPLLHFVMGLQQLSVTLITANGNSIEAHLVSVYASASAMSDKSFAGQLRMGWFWILDRIRAENFPRRQRLVAHSNLPRSFHSLADTGNYDDIITDLLKMGVFEKYYSGSTELADITYQTFVPNSPGIIPTNENVLNAKFSSLFVHWNPSAIKGMTSMLDQFQSMMDEHLAAAASEANSNALILSSPDKLSPRRRIESWGEKTPSTPKPIPSPERLKILAEMESLDIYLNSARDDYPLFVLTMSNAKVELSSSPNQNMEALFVLGDVRMATPADMGSTLPAYRTLIGLAPGHSDSLLTVKYCVGDDAIERLGLPNPERRTLEACAEVELSPMRMVYIQSQIMALVEYITEGILGALTAQAATSAAEAAKDFSSSTLGEKFFLIKANAFDVVLPQAACSDKTVTVRAGTLAVEYRILPEPGGGEARVSLSDVSLRDTSGNLMQEAPIRMDLHVTLPPDDMGTLDDQAMRVNIEISEAAFVVSKSQYGQLLCMLSENMGEEQLFLREENASIPPKMSQALDAGESRKTSVPSSGENKSVMTHAGVAVVVRSRRIYLRLNIKVLALQLCGSSIFDPIVRIAAVEAAICWTQLPDQFTSKSDVSLRNLVCDDWRKKSMNRQYRALISQGRSAGSADGDLDFFRVTYTSRKDASDVDLRIGAPQIVFIPDAIADILSFLRVENDSKVPVEFPLGAELETDVEELNTEVVQVDGNETGEDFETTLLPSPRINVSRMDVSIKTQRCRFILVDLGSQLAAMPPRQHDPVSLVSKNQVAETIVIQGIFSTKLSIATEVKTGEIHNAQVEAHCDGMEIFTAFGADLRSPLQILDPAEFSVYGSLKAMEARGLQIEMRAAALKPFDFALSMHNAALVQAILAGLSESLASDEHDMLNDAPRCLDDEEAQRIEKLALELGSVDKAENLVSQQSISVDESSVAPSRLSSQGADASMKIEIKITLPETRITIINDLQGLDEALFRITVMNFVAGGELSKSVTELSRAETTFDFRINTAVLADYFDSSLNLWNQLLLKPWETTLKGIRSPSRRFQSDRLSTSLDLESMPCHVAFSEQFLMSLASANRMWSIYSIATAAPTEGDGKLSEAAGRDRKLKQSMAASAARNLILSLPYAVENHSGVNASFRSSKAESISGI